MAHPRRIELWLHGCWTGPHPQRLAAVFQDGPVVALDRGTLRRGHGATWLLRRGGTESAGARLCDRLVLWAAQCCLRNGTDPFPRGACGLGVAGRFHGSRDHLASARGYRLVHLGSNHAPVETMENISLFAIQMSQICIALGLMVAACRS